MTLSERLRLLRKEIGISQEAMGSQGFVSVPGWIKIENGQRLASDLLLHRLVGWLLRDKYVKTDRAAELLEELLTIKYLDCRSAFVRKLAYNHAKQLLWGTAIKVSEHPGVYRPRRPRGRRTTSEGTQTMPESGATGTPNADADSVAG